MVAYLNVSLSHCLVLQSPSGCYEAGSQMPGTLANYASILWNAAGLDAGMSDLLCGGRWQFLYYDAV
jgi:hypothetical protein